MKLPSRPLLPRDTVRSLHARLDYFRYRKESIGPEKYIRPLFILHEALAKEVLATAREAGLPDREISRLFRLIGKRANADVHLMFLKPALKVVAEKLGHPAKIADFLLSTMKINLDSLKVLPGLLTLGVSPDQVILFLAKIQARTPAGERLMCDSVEFAYMRGLKGGIELRSLTAYIHKIIDEADEEYAIALIAFGWEFGSFPPDQKQQFPLLAEEYVNLCRRFNGNLSMLLGPVQTLRLYFEQLKDKPEAALRHFELQLQVLKFPLVTHAIIGQLMTAVIDGQIPQQISDEDANQIRDYIRTYKLFLAADFKYCRRGKTAVVSGNPEALSPQTPSSWPLRSR